MKRGIKAGPPYCVAEDEHECLCAPSVKMTPEELAHIEDNFNQGYRWGCEMKLLIDTVKYYQSQGV